MRHVIPILLLVLLQGCSMHSRNRDGDRHGLPVYDGVSAGYPAASYSLASAAAEELARRYVPAQTTLAVASDETDFNRDLRAALRALDFSVVPSGSLQVGYTLDLIKDQVPPTCYLQVRTSEGDGFGMVRDLSAYSAPAAVEPPPASSRPLESRPLQDDPVTTPDVASLPASPAVPASASAHEAPLPAAQAPVSAPTEPQSTHATMATVRIKSSVSRYAKSKRIAVTDFCRWNQVRPETVLEPGRKVFVESPGKASNQEANRDRPSKPLVESNSREQSPAGDRASAAPVAMSAPPKPADPVPAATPAGSAPSEPSPVQDALAELSGSKVEEPKVVVPAVPEEPDPWRISPGSLHGQIQVWAIRANYRVIWRASRDLEMQSTASFNGSFVDAIRQIFSSLHRSGFPLRVKVFQGNNVLEVSED